MSQVRQNFDKSCEDGINKQINMELYASYVYLSMSSYFDRDDVALENIRDYFKHQSDEEREHAEKLMKYLNKRGGRFVALPINAPEQNEWTSLSAFEAALALEKTVNQSLLDLHETASKANDPQMTDFLEGEYLAEQVESIKEISDFITNIKRNGSGLGEYLFDKFSFKK